ncbi:MAG: RluA family pseudouridine synthase [Bacteroidota bacterium]
MSNEPDKIETITEISVPPGQEGGVRLDVYLAGKLPNTTRAKVQRGIKEGRVDVNGKTVKRPSHGVQPGDHLLCRILRPPPMEIEPEDIPLDIVFEDEAVIVLNKPAGMVVHPAIGHRTGTLIHALLHHVGAGPLAADTVEDEDDEDVGLATATAGARYDGDPTVRPGLVHRLDKGTSGLMVIAKTDAVAAHLGHQFMDRTIQREYVALVWGVPEAEGRVESWLGRDPRDRKRVSVRPEGEGKWAATNYWVEEDLGHLALVRFKLETGRTHQIRIHARHIGHAVFGDRTYGGDSILYGRRDGSRKKFFANLFEALPRQALHARTLGFVHPVTEEEVFFESALPEDIAYVAQRIREVEGSQQPR